MEEQDGHEGQEATRSQDCLHVPFWGETILQGCMVFEFRSDPPWI